MDVECTFRRLPSRSMPARPRAARRSRIHFARGCHPRTGTLTGGQQFAAEIPVRIGSFISSNLTPAGSLAQ